MNITEALLRMEQGDLLTRPALQPRFLVRRGGRLLAGAYIGESGLAEMHAHTLSQEERAAQDWIPYTRVLPDEWTGCDAPDA